MKTKHTPGPWVMDIEKQTTGHWYYKIVTEEKPLGNYPLHICTLNKFKDETHLKNANLIAAAPEMLEALENALRLLAVAENNNAFKDCALPLICKKTIEQIELTINKAKGE